MSFQISEQFFHIFVIAWTFLALISLPRILAQSNNNLKSLFKPNSFNPGLIIPSLISGITFLTIFLIGNHAKTKITWLFFAFWILHYSLKIVFNLLNPKDNETQASNIKTHSTVLLINALINGYYLGWLWPAYAISWTKHTAFICGSIFLGTGFIIQTMTNVKLYLSNRNEAKVLESGLHKIIFCPSYFGEILQWGGFALITWSTPAAAMFCWMLALLFAQATAQKQMYLLKFPTLPITRKAFVPFIF